MPEPKTLQVFLMTETATLPKRGSEGAVGYDLSADLMKGKLAGPTPVVTIFPGDRALISTGLKMAIPDGYYGRVAPRSGLALKKGIVVLGGVVDPDYRGEVFVLLLNTGSERFTIDHGDRIAQLILERVTTPPIARVYSVDDLGDTDRGAGGFGSTGVK